MDHLAQLLLDFIAAHPNWAIAVMFIIAFGESFAFLSLLFPGTTLLVAAGALIKTGLLVHADHDRCDRRCGVRRLGLVLDRPTMGRRHCPDMAV